MTTLIPFSIWTTIFTAINSANSRAKNTASRTYNAVSTALVSGAYIISIAFGMNLILQSYAHKDWRLFAAVVACYMASSSAGSVAGQAWAIKFERNHHIQH
jgi:hypothetical protein